jgi:two-component SAPR family response regulator
MTSPKTPACRVLVVEDEMLIAVVIEDALAEIGFEVVGPASKLETAWRLMEESQFDIAILDVSVRGQKIYPVAERLLALGVPFALASGYGDWALPEALRDRPKLMKPFTMDALQGLAKFLHTQIPENRS